MNSTLQVFTLTHFQFPVMDQLDQLDQLDSTTTAINKRQQQTVPV